MLKKAFVFLIKLMSKMKDDNIIALSAQFSYYIILGIFPFLILALSILSNYSNYIYDILSSLKSILPPDVYNIVSSFIHSSTYTNEKSYFSASVLVILWSATAGSSTIIKGINRAYGFTVTKNYFLMRIEGVIFTAAIMLLMQLVFTLIVLGNEIVLFLQKFALISDITWLTINISRYVLPFILLFLIFSSAYKFLTYEKVNLKFVLPGAVFSTIGFIVGSLIFSNYIGTKTMYYSSIYGNLSGLIIFLIWIFILSIIFLTGAEINYFTGRLKFKKIK